MMPFFPSYLTPQFFVGYNPQYSIRINVPENFPGGVASLWAHLSIHVTNTRIETKQFHRVGDAQDESSSKIQDDEDYLTLLLYRGDGTRVYYPIGPSSEICMFRGKNCI